MEKLLCLFLTVAWVINNKHDDLLSIRHRKPMLLNSAQTKTIAAHENWAVFSSFSSEKISGLGADLFSLTLYACVSDFQTMPRNWGHGITWILRAFSWYFSYGMTPKWEDSCKTSSHCDQDGFFARRWLAMHLSSLPIVQIQKKSYNDLWITKKEVC